MATRVQAANGVSIVTIIITLFGLTANAISLSFYIRSAERNLGNRLLLLLTIADILTCLDFSVVVGFYWGRDSIISSMRELLQNDTAAHNDIEVFNELMNDFPMFCWLDGVFRVCSDLSVCVTTVLCVTRCVAFTQPFLLIKNKAVFLSLGLCALLFLTGRTMVLVYQLNDIPENFTASSEGIPMIAELVFSNHAWLQGATVCLLVVAGSSCFYSGWVLYRSRATPGKTLAPEQVSVVWTVAILGVLLIITNLASTTSFFILYGDLEELQEYFVDVTFWDLLWVNYIALTFNSSLNPAVYIIRTKALREYVRRGWRRGWRRVCRVCGREGQRVMNASTVSKNDNTVVTVMAASQT